MLRHYAHSFLYQGWGVVKSVVFGCFFVLLFASSDCCQQKEGFCEVGWGGEVVIISSNDHGGGYPNWNFYSQAP